MAKFKKVKVPKEPKQPKLDIPTLMWIKAFYETQAAENRNYEIDAARRCWYDDAIYAQHAYEHAKEASYMCGYWIQDVKTEAKFERKAEPAKTKTKTKTKRKKV